MLFFLLFIVFLLLFTLFFLLILFSFLLLSLFWARFSFLLHQYYKPQQSINNISIEQSTMKKTRAIIFNVVFQLALAILILDFQTNPQHLRIKCISAHAESETLGKGQIIDCIACQTLNTKDIQNQFIGYFSILVPLSSFPSGLNPLLPFDSTAMNDNRLSTQFKYAVDVYTQLGCTNYDCPSFQLLDDFKFSQKQHRDLLNKHNIENSGAIFKKSNLSITSISYQLGIGYQQETIVLQSNFLNKNDVSSLMMRTRYSVANRVEEDTEPAILLYQLQTNILARFILILVVLLQSSSLYVLLSHFKTYLKNVIFFVMAIGFYSSTAAIIASTLAIYLTIAKKYNAGKYGIISALIFSLFCFLFTSGRVSFNTPAIMVIIYSILIFFKQVKDNFNLLAFGTMIGFIIAAVSMWRLGWHFYILITPLLILAGLLSIHQEKEVPKRPTNYNLVNFNDQEQDVLARIQRQLR